MAKAKCGRNGINEHTIGKQQQMFTELISKTKEENVFLILILIVVFKKREKKTDEEGLYKN